MLESHVGVPIQISVALLLSQLLTNAPGKHEMTASICDSATHMGDDEVLPTYGLLWPFEE